MKRQSFIVSGLCVLSALGTSALAQTIYRCGDSYSQTACPGGQPVQAADERTKAQKAQAEAALQRDSRAASSLEKNRLKQEAAQSRASRSRPGYEASGHGFDDDRADPSRNGPYFTARSGQPPKKKDSKGKDGAEKNAVAPVTPARP